MSLGQTTCVALHGLDGAIVTVEVDIADGLPMYSLLGLPDAALNESRDRVRAARGDALRRGPPRRRGEVEVGRVHPPVGTEPVTDLHEQPRHVVDPLQQADGDHRVERPGEGDGLGVEVTHHHVVAGDRRFRVPGVGSPHVHQRSVGLREPRVLGADDVGGCALGREGLQLDRHHVEGFHDL